MIGDLRPQVMINAAAYTAVDQAEEDIDAARAVNADAPALIADLCVQHNARLIHLSTDFVFDGTGHKTLSPDAQALTTRRIWPIESGRASRLFCSAVLAAPCSKNQLGLCAPWS